MVHAHVGFWTLLLIFFILSYVFIVVDMPGAQKIMHMITRLLYICVFATGLYLVISYGIVYKYWGYPILKGIAGLIIISMMEMILIKTRKKQKSTTLYWVIFLLALIAAFYLGYEVIRIG